MKHLSTFSKIMYLVCAVVFLAQSSAAALSDAQKTVFRSGVDYFNVDPGVSSCGNGTPLVGSNFGEQIYNFFISKGLSPIQAAGFMGNLTEESGMNPARVQGTRTPQGDRDTMSIDGSTGYGLAQWTSIDRQRKLHDAATAAQKKDSDIGVQLNYLWTELNGGYKSSTLTPLLAATDIHSATSIVMLHFESPKNQSQTAQDARARIAIGILAKYGSTTTPAAAAAGATVIAGSCGTVAGGAADQITGGVALPVDKSWYTAHKEWFTKPHHDYPAADIPVPLGTKVYSMTAGKIIQAPASNGCGIGVVIQIKTGEHFTYCHGSDGGSVPGARQGDTVVAGQLIMHSASTGNSTGPHVHVQITINSVKHCPQNLLVAVAEGKPLPSLASLPISGCTY